MPAAEWRAPERTLEDLRRRASSRPSLKSGFVRSESNLPLLLPAVDWEDIVSGVRPMFRCYAADPVRRESSILPDGLEFPRPFLAYTQRGDRGRTRVATPMILLAHRMEPLGAISEEDRAAEGFEFMGQFRWYWKGRHRKLGWRPWEMVNVVTLRPPVSADWAWCGEYLMTRLFGAWM